jgi:phenylacetate-CoA ligase
MKFSKYLKLAYLYILYSKYYHHTKKLLKEGEFQRKEDVESYQFNRLKETIEYAYQNVPYYKELLDSNHFLPENFQSLNDLNKIPYLTKNTIREKQEQLISNTFSRKYIKVAETGGTTGLPMSFILDNRTSSLIEMAYLQDIWKRINYKRYDRCIVLREDQVQNIIPGKKYWKLNHVVNWLIMSSFHLNSDTFLIFYNKIISFKPKYIMAFPSNAYLLARFIKEHDLPAIKTLKGIICSSENIYGWQREYIEDVFKVKVLSYYGHSEKCAIAAECIGENLYEFYPQYGYVELVNDKNNWCTEEDEIGEIVVTGFNHMAAPFIRYRTNDMGIFTRNKSKNHPYWFTIKRIEGRKQDFIIDKDGTPKTSIHIDRPFWNIRNDIYAYQYIQDVPGKVTVNVHAKNDLKKNQIEEIKKIFTETYFKFEIEIKQVDNIPRTRNGKFKYLVQNIKIF